MLQLIVSSCVMICLLEKKKKTNKGKSSAYDVNNRTNHPFDRWNCPNINTKFVEIWCYCVYYDTINYDKSLVDGKWLQMNRSNTTEKKAQSNPITDQTIATNTCCKSQNTKSQRCLFPVFLKTSQICRYLVNVSMFVAHAVCT